MEPLPTTPGAECVGRVTSVGSAVTHLKKGDLVINLQRENWAQKRRVKGDDAIPLPAGIDLRQAAMVRINPPTAQLMLQDFVDLKPGEWVIQNVANSAVGRLLIVLAKQRGLRTVNVVRRPELDAELKSLGADLVVVDGDDLAARVAKGTGEAAIRLGVDPIELRRRKSHERILRAPAIIIPCLYLADLDKYPDAERDADAWHATSVRLHDWRRGIAGAHALRYVVLQRAVQVDIVVRQTQFSRHRRAVCAPGPTTRHCD